MTYGLYPSQQCKNCIITYILPSQQRTTALSRYLLAFSKSCQPKPSDFKIAEHTGPDYEIEGLDPKDGLFLPPRSVYRRLHLVYILHDVVASAHAWRNSEDVPSNLRHLDMPATIAKLKEQMVSLVRLAACRGEYNADEASQPILKLVTQWRNLPILGDEEANALQSLANSCHERTWEQALEDCAREADQRAAEERRAREETYKWTVPRRHGVKDDPEAPWYELPAANGLYMKSTRGFPLRAGAFPKGGYQLKNGGKFASR